MRRSTRLAGAVLLVTAAGGTGLAAAAFGDINDPARVARPAVRLDPPRDQPGIDDTAAGLAAAQVVNAERAERGLPALQWHPQVGAAAIAHATDMAAHGRMQHAGSDGSDAGDRLRRHGFVWGAWGENVAAGHQTVESLVAAWLNSPGHRNNLLGAYRYIGVGVAVDARGVPYWDLVVAS